MRDFFKLIGRTVAGRIGAGGLLGSVFLGLVPLATAWAGEKVVVVEGYRGYSDFYDGAMLVNSRAKKLYAGRGITEGEYEKGLWVYDIDAVGEVTGSDERILPNSPDPHPASPDGSPTYYCRAVRDMALSPDGRKLYLGLCGVRHPERKPLVVYDLNEKGEPVGKPRSYEVAAGCANIDSLRFGPQTNLLYTVANASPGICVFSLVNGEPSAAPAHYPFGEIYNYAILPTEDWTALLIGGYPSRVGVVGISSSGEPEIGESIPAKAVKTKTWMVPARVGQCLYFVADSQLWSWPLDKNWRPIGQPKICPGIAAARIMGGVRSSLYVVLEEYRGDGKAKEPTFVGSRVARYKPDAQGNPGKPEFLSDLLEKRIRNLTVDDSTGVIYISTWGVN